MSKSYNGQSAFNSKSNQVEIWSSTGDNEALIQNNKIRSQGNAAWVTWPTFQILGPSNISGTAEDTNLKFCVKIDLEGY